VFVVLVGVSNGLGRMIAGYISGRYRLPSPVFLGFAVALMSLATLILAFANFMMLYVAIPLVGACIAWRCAVKACAPDDLRQDSPTAPFGASRLSLERSSLA
jgi:hypothetical protein